MNKEGLLTKKSNEGLFMAVHVLQSYPSNCLNRGEDNSPKSCIFGGVRRSRVSSQCIKRNARLELYKRIEENDDNGMGIRTKTMPAMIKDYLSAWATDPENIHWTEDEAKKKEYHEAAKNFDIRDVAHALSTMGMQMDSKKKAVLKGVYYTTKKQCEAFAKAMLDIGSKRVSKGKDKEDVKFAAYDEDEAKLFDDVLNNNLALDIMMFGRMNAGRPLHNVEACVQVAHEFSTHQVEEEFDYFVAVDDMVPANQGSAHLDVAEFSSSTMYRYCCVDLGAMSHAIQENGANIKLALLAKEWVRAFALANPSGKQNSYSANTAPAYVFVSLYKEAPTSYANAFEKPVPSSNDGYVKASIAAFENAVEQDAKMEWREAPIAQFVTSECDTTLTDCVQESFKKLLSDVENTVEDEVDKMLADSKEVR